MTLKIIITLLVLVWIAIFAWALRVWWIATEYERRAKFYNRRNKRIADRYYNKKK